MISPDLGDISNRFIEWLQHLVFTSRFAFLQGLRNGPQKLDSLLGGVFCGDHAALLPVIPCA
jgi:hypothetical protein